MKRAGNRNPRMVASGEEGSVRECCGGLYGKTRKEGNSIEQRPLYTFSILLAERWSLGVAVRH